MSTNVEFLKRFVGSDEIRWLSLSSSDIPQDREWKMIAPLSPVKNISMGRKVAREIDTTGFQGAVDYVLLNYVKQRCMIVCACFAHENDALLWEARQNQD